MNDIHYDATDGGKPLVQERAAVKKGAQLLDKVLPGWHNEVALDKLDMSEGSMCMMGQLFGTGVESKLAETMYPQELDEAREAYAGQDYYDRDVENGFGVAGTFRHPEESLIGKLMRKIGLSLESKESLAKFLALEHVCQGHDNACLWAEQVAERRAKEAEGGKACKRAKA